MAGGVLGLFPAGAWVGLQCVIVTLPGHTHLLFNAFLSNLTKQFERH